MKTKQERTIESYDIHTQLYLHVDEDQNRRHQRFRYMYNVLAILAALIPPVSLLFTVQASRMERKQSGFSTWQAIGASFFFAIVPIASGIMSWNIIDKLENARRRTDKIQKTTMSKEDWIYHSALLKQTKNQMNELGINVKARDLSLISRKKKKVIIEYQEDEPKLSFNGEMVDVYMDVAQIDRDRKLSCCAITLRENNEGKDNEQLLGLTYFFKNKHAESVAIVEELETQYNLKR
nr:hypothetical protein [Legionella jordanis]